MIADAGWLLAELVALFFGVAFALHLLQRRVGADRVQAWMGGTPVVSALKGIAVGFVTPFCTFSAIPMLVGMRRAGVGPAGYVAFICAAPVLDPILFGALVVIVGVEAALIYTAVAFTATMALALTAERVGIDRHLKPLPVALAPSPNTRSVPGTTGAAAWTVDTETEPTTIGGCRSVGDPDWQGLRREAGAATRAALALLRSVGLLLLVGVTIGLVIEALVSPDMVASLTGINDAWSIPVAAALGTPLYFHTSLFVPIANSLTNAGVGIGAIVALTISGAGANLPEFVILTKLADRRLIGTFFAYVFAVALTGGLLAQILLT